MSRLLFYFINLLSPTSPTTNWQAYIPTIIFFKKNYVFIILKINTLVNSFLANQFILSITQ